MKKIISALLSIVFILTLFISTVEAIDSVDPTGHDHDYQLTKEVERTCTEDGYDLYICSVCGDEKREVTSYASHMYKEEELVESDCENDGYVVLKCSVCGDENRITIPKTDHEWTESTVLNNPSTFINGKIRYTCKYNSEHTYEISIPSKFASSTKFKVEVIIAAVAIVCIPVIAITVFSVMKKKKKITVAEKRSKK